MHSTETVDIQCPYCGETVAIIVDCSVASQRYIEDCEVCCRPLKVAVLLDEEGFPTVEVAQEDEV